MLRQVALSAFHRADQTPTSREVKLWSHFWKSSAERLQRIKYSGWTQNVNTHDLRVAVSASRLEFCLPLVNWSVTVESVLHLSLAAVLLEDVLLIELVLLLRHHAGQFEEQSDISNIVSLDAQSCWDRINN